MTHRLAGVGLAIEGQVHVDIDGGGSTFGAVAVQVVEEGRGAAHRQAGRGRREHRQRAQNAKRGVDWHPGRAGRDLVADEFLACGQGKNADWGADKRDREPGNKFGVRC